MSETKTVEEYEKEIESNWNWDLMVFNPNDCEDANLEGFGEDDHTKTTSYYLGSVLFMHPSHAYYTCWTTDQSEKDVAMDTNYMEALDHVANKHGGYITSGEGDLLDTYFCIDKEVEVYKYDDLSEPAKNKAREWVLETGELDLDFLKDEIEIELEEFGFTSPTVRYSISYSQGDGASFTTSCIDVDLFIEKCLPEDMLPKLREVLHEGMFNLYGSLHSYSRYCHEHSTTLNLEWELGSSEALCVDDYTTQDLFTKNLFDPFEQFMKDWIVSKGQDIYHRLMKEYEYQTSTEQAEEMIRLNDYTFDEFGDRA